MNSEVIRLAVIRAETTDEGVDIFCKSELIPRFFEDLAGGITIKSLNEGWEGEVFHCTDPRFNNFNLIGYGLFENNKPNLSFFKFKDVIEGKTFKLNYGMISRTKLKEWEEQATKELVDFYNKNMRKHGFELVLNLRHMPGVENV